MHLEDMLMTMRNLHETKGEKTITLLVDLHYITATGKEVVVPLCFMLAHEHLLMNEVSAAKYCKHKILKMNFCFRAMKMKKFPQWLLLGSI